MRPQITTLLAVRRAAVFIAILLAAVTLGACGKDNPATGDAETTTPAPAQTATTAKATGTATTATSTGTATTARPATEPTVQPRSTHDGCKAVAPPEPSTDPDRRRSRQRLSTSRVYTLVMRTNCGTLRIRLSSITWPKTTASFAGLVRNKFFDGLTFHRIAKPGGNDYVIQGGDPLGTGNGGPGYSIFETPPSTTKYPRYTVAMAKSQDERPGTSGSQFFIVTAPAGAPLDPDYAVLGKVTGGQNVVRRIARVATDPATEMPIDPVVISSVRIRSTAR
jgi:peptidyl-prolyl cis-trans isomerase B (cyclophilin B)